MSAQEPEIQGDDAPVVPELGTTCRHLRHNGSYIFTDGSSIDSEGEESTSTFWCLKTMKSFGPDDGYVGRNDCRRIDRPCYEPL